MKPNWRAAKPRSMPTSIARCPSIASSSSCRRREAAPDPRSSTSSSTCSTRHRRRRRRHRDVPSPRSSHTTRAGERFRPPAGASGERPTRCPGERARCQWPAVPVRCAGARTPRDGAPASRTTSPPRRTLDPPRQVRRRDPAGPGVRRWHPPLHHRERTSYSSSAYLNAIVSVQKRGTAWLSMCWWWEPAQPA